MPIKRAFGMMRVLRAEPAGSVTTRGAGTLQRIIACEDRLEEALHFLVTSMAEKPKRGKKPVVIHSLRVAWALLAMGYATDVVIAGLLHDILEKTSLNAGQLARRFGTDVSLMVSAATNNPRIHDSLARYEDSLLRCAGYGEGALIVRAADLMDNCDRLVALGAYVRLERVAEKMKMLIKICREHLVDEHLVEELQKRLRRINRKVGGLAPVHQTPKKAHAPGKGPRLSFHHK